MAGGTFVGIGFGAIQSGLFLYEAHASGNFSRLVVAEVVPDVVAALRAAGGTYRINVAMRDGVAAHAVPGVEIYNPHDPADRDCLIQAIGEAGEIATALPSVAFYGSGEPGDVVDLLSAGFRRCPDGCSVIYAAENHNHAAEQLAQRLQVAGVPSGRVQCLNTVIGKMSGIVADHGELAARGLQTVTDGMPRAFLVEAFNRILISAITLPGFRRGITAFVEKRDLLPFEEAKLYGHNATHALIGYLLDQRGATLMSDAAGDGILEGIARDAFLRESGDALCRKYAGVDALFTPEGYAAYVADLMVRMLNPYLGDKVDRITRDPRRKLGWNDRLIGTMRLALGQGITPARYAMGARAALERLSREERKPPVDLLERLWEAEAPDPVEAARIRTLLLA